MVSKVPNLKYLDDRPIKSDEVRLARAWAEGGTAKENEMRQIIRDEQSVDISK